MLEPRRRERPPRAALVQIVNARIAPRAWGYLALIISFATCYFIMKAETAPIPAGYALCIHCTDARGNDVDLVPMGIKNSPRRQRQVPRSRRSDRLKRRAERRGTPVDCTSDTAFDPSTSEVNRCAGFKVTYRRARE